MAHVLLVDDCDDSRSLVGMYLEDDGHIVFEARDGEQALHLAVMLAPDVIVMELGVPGIDGWEATRRLKSDPRTCHVPVIALTAHAWAAHHPEDQPEGLAAFLTKPCEPESLLATIDGLLARAA